MNRPIVIHPSNLHFESPVPTCAIIFLLMAHFGAPDWAFVAFYVVSVFALYGWYMQRRSAVEVDLFGEAKRESGDD